MEYGIRMKVRKTGCRVWSGFSWLRIGTGGGFFENGDELSGCGVTELVVQLLTNKKLPNSVNPTACSTLLIQTVVTADVMKTSSHF
jgi:hypothetical protein